MTYVPPTSEEKLEALRKQFRLDGEKLVRVGRTRVDGSPWYVDLTKQKSPDMPALLAVTISHRRAFTIALGRAKFYLLHGWLPEQVCHRDGDQQNLHSSNLFPLDEPPGRRNQWSK